MSKLIKKSNPDKSGHLMVECQCECGVIRVTRKARCTLESKCLPCSRKKDNSYAISGGVVHMDVSTSKFPNATTVFDECFLNHVIDGKGRWFAADFCKGVTYAVRNKKGYKLHRHILSPNDSALVDHRDGNGLNNLLENIRLSSHSDNARNKSISHKNKTGVLGVYKHSQIDKFVAQISNGIKTIHLGCFDTIEQAAEARNEAMLKYKYQPEHGTRSIVR